MTEEPTRAMPRDPGAPPHGSVGPVDPHADPATDPRGMRPVPRLDAPTVATPARPEIPVVAPPPRPDAPTVATPARPDASPARREAPTVPTHGRPDPAPVGRTRTGGLWTGLVLSAVVLVFLLVFILQNSVPVTITFLVFSGTLPTGVALLLAAVAGLLLVAIPGGLRILQLRRAARRR